MSTEKIYIPYYVSDDKFTATTVSPRLLFYNGTKSSIKWYVNDANSEQYAEVYPYFSNYSGAITSEDSKSLLFYNEDPEFGVVPTDSLYTKFWSKYISTLYDPSTRILSAKSLIPLSEYFKLTLNDIIEFRGNYYHLRSINNYNLNTGECDIELLGPIIYDSLNINIPLYIEFPTVFLTSWSTAGYHLTINGNVSSEGSSELTSVGIVWSNLVIEPELDDNVIAVETALGDFVVNFTISDSTEYFFRVYASNEYGTSYSDTIYVYKTSADILPTVQTLSMSNITNDDATFNLNLSDIGDSSVVELGWVYSNSITTPTTSNGKKVLSSSLTIGNHSKNVSNTFIIGNTYYVRAYAKNSYGTSYGSVTTFSPVNKTYTFKLLFSNQSSHRVNEGEFIFNIIKDPNNFPSYEQTITPAAEAYTNYEYTFTTSVTNKDNFAFSMEIPGDVGEYIGFEICPEGYCYAVLMNEYGDPVDGIDYNFGGVDNTWDPGNEQYPYAYSEFNIVDDAGGDIIIFYVNLLDKY